MALFYVCHDDRTQKNGILFFSGNTLLVQSTAIFEDLRLHRRIEMIQDV
jgi:hypothetical protein